MKKLSYFIAGTLVGATIMTAGSAFADDIKQLINSKVGSVWELHVDGKQVGDVPIIKGSSYAPVRQIAEIAGFNVEFETGKVYLESKGSGELVTEGEIEGLELQIKMNESLKKGLENRRAETQEKIKTTSDTKVIEGLNEHIAVLNEGIADYEKEIAALNVKLAEAKAKQAVQSLK